MSGTQAEAGTSPATRHQQRRLAVSGRALFLLALFLVSQPRPVMAQETGRLSDLFSVRSWTRDHGLPDNRVRCLLQTRDGYLWIGTRSGIARFDGTRFVVFDRSTTPGMEQQQIETMVEDPSGAIWFTSQSYLFRLMNGVCSLACSTDGKRLWVDGGIAGGTDSTVWAFGGDAAWKIHETRGWTNTLPIRAILDHPLSGTWALDGSKLHLLSYDTGLPKAFDLPDVETHYISAAFSAGPQGKVRFLHGDARYNCTLYEATPAGPVALTPPRPGNAARFSFLMTDHQDRLWYSVGTEGLECVSSNGITRYPLPWRRPNEVALCMLTDREGDLWVGMEESGLYRLGRRSIRALGMAQGLPTDSTRCVIPGGSGSVWIGTDDGVVEVAHDGIGPVRVVRTNLLGQSVRALAPGAEGTLWTGTSRGLFVGNNGQFTPVPLPQILHAHDPQRLGSIKIRSLLPTQDQEVWVAAPYHLTLLDPARDSRRLLAAFLEDKAPTALAGDHAGNFWITTDGSGLFGFHRQALDRFRTEDPPLTNLQVGLGQFSRSATVLRVKPAVHLGATNGLASDHVETLYQDSERTLWVASERGLDRVRLRTDPSGKPMPPEQITRFTQANGLYENHIVAITEDLHGNLWFGTAKGIFRVALNELTAVAERRLDQVRSFSYTIADGLPHDEIVGRTSHPSACRTPDGLLWFSTTRGMAIINPRQLLQEEIPPKVVIESVHADGAAVFDNASGATPDHPRSASPPTILLPGPLPTPGPSPALTLHVSKARVLEFQFTSPTLNASEATRFRYQLAGYETNWHAAGKRKSAHYTNLDPGAYRFRVTAGNHHDLWSTEVAEFAFILEPHYWQTPAFKLGAITLVAALFWGGVQLRLRQQRRFHRMELEVAQHRNREEFIRNLHDRVGMRLSNISLLAGRIKTSPDPALASDLDKATTDLRESIGDLIWGCDTDFDYLHLLALHLRQVSTRYLADAGLAYELNIPPGLPPRPMPAGLRTTLDACVQECLHNVVKHASARHVRLDLSLEKDSLLVGVTDDGVGFDPASVKRDPGGRSKRGLANLRSRAQEWGGTVQIDSSPGKGTVIRMIFPLPDSTDRGNQP